MPTETAQVVSLPSAGRALIRVKRGEACACCQANGICRTFLDKGDALEIEVRNPLGVIPGDTVEVSLADSTFLQLSALVYLVPIIGLLGGAILGYLIAQAQGLSRDMAAFILGLLGFSLSLRRQI